MVSMNRGAVRLVSEVRRVAWLVGGVLLVVIGLVCLALPPASLLGGQPGGFGLLAIAAGLLALGLAALRGVASSGFSAPSLCWSVPVFFCSSRRPHCAA